MTATQASVPLALRTDALRVPHRDVKRVGIYGRVSDMSGKDETSETFRSKPDQRAEALTFLPGGARVVDEYWDLDVSGRKDKRPELDRLFADLQSGRLDAVLVPYLSRFGRTGAQILSNVERVKQLNRVFLEARHGIDTRKGAGAQLLLHVLSIVAELEWEKIVGSLWGANDAAAARGVSITVPYGYVRSDGHGTVLVLDVDDTHGPAPADVVQLVYQLRLSGWGASAIADELTRRQVPTPLALRKMRRGDVVHPLPQWRHNSVANMLSVVTYRGVIPRSANGVEWEQTGPDGAFTHPPIVDPDDWHRAQLDGERPASWGRNGSALLQGIVRCATCSHTMSPSAGGKGTLVYRCSTKGCTKRASINRDRVDEYVLANVYDATQQPELHELDDPAVRDELVARVERAQRRRARLRELDPADVEDFGAQVRDARLAEEDAQRDLDEHRNRARYDVEAITELPLDVQREALSGSVVVVVEPTASRSRHVPVDERVHIIRLSDVDVELPRSGRSVGIRAFPLPERH
jgi:DNA invertase Pin-like site-specific DNA recombinase